MYYILSEQDEKYWSELRNPKLHRLVELEEDTSPRPPEDVFPLLQEKLRLRDELDAIDRDFDSWYEINHPCEEHRQHDGEHCEVCKRWLGHCYEHDDYESEEVYCAVCCREVDFEYEGICLECHRLLQNKN